MCVIIAKPADKKISYRTLRRAYHNNPDGWGLVARAEDGTFTVQRGIGSVRDLLHAYRQVENQEVVIHTRIGTSGKKDILNTHPFPFYATSPEGEVIEQFYLMHNGILSKFTVGFDLDENKDFCDTWHFARAIENTLNKHLEEYLQEDFFREWCVTTIAKQIGSGNKFVIMRKSGFIIVNESAGTWKDGVWYSNHSAFRYKTRTKTTTAMGGSFTSSRYAGWDDEYWGSNEFGRYKYDATKGTTTYYGPYAKTAQDSGTKEGVTTPPKSAEESAKVLAPPLLDCMKSAPADLSSYRTRKASGALVVVDGKTMAEEDYFKLLEAEEATDIVEESQKWEEALTMASALQTLSCDQLIKEAKADPEAVATVLFYALQGDLPGIVRDDDDEDDDDEVTDAEILDRVASAV